MSKKSEGPAITVIGSSNTDMVIKSNKLPAPGETILGGSFLMNPGGKGANQAVAAAKLGGQVSFIAKVGDDIFGREAREGFEKVGIDTQFVFTDPEHPSGVALIMVEQSGENCISVALGANNHLTSADIDQAERAFEDSEYLLIQLEIPVPTVAYAIEKAVGMGKKVILNPAPAQTLMPSVLRGLYLITPNETEAAMMTGVEVLDESSAAAAAAEFRNMGIQTVIITMGSKGAFVSGEEFQGLVPTPKVRAMDTTAAGDTFNGALAVALGEGKNLEEAVKFANRAASISVTRIGAQASTPYRSEMA